MTYSNAQILAAVLTKWLRPMIQGVSIQAMAKSSMVSSINTMLRKSGWVGMNYDVTQEVYPMIGGVIDKVAQPMIESFLGSLPDATIPAVAHAAVEEAMKTGELSLLDGNISFSEDDLKKLKRLLDLNLPLKDVEGYEVMDDDG